MMLRGFLDFERFGCSPALLSGKETLSYTELARRCDAFAARLPSPKSLMLLRADNSGRSLVALYGALRAGHAVALAEHNNDRLVQQLSESYGADLIYDPSADELAATGAGVEPASQLHADLALLLSTSGTTGSSKAVRLSFEGLDENAGAIASYLGIREEDRALLTLPIHYCYGLSVVNSHFKVGASVIVGPATLTNAHFRDTLVTQRVTTFPCVPFSIELLERQHFRTWDLPDLRYITQAGGALAPALVRDYARWARRSGRDFFVMYGQTEATARMAYLPTAQALQEPDSIGMAIPGGDFTLFGEDGASIDGLGEVGELVYRGPNVMLGYALCRADLAKGREVFELHTGDLASRTASGNYRIVGRLKRFAKLYGKRLNLQDAEIFVRDRGIACAITSDDRKLFVAVASPEAVAPAQTLLHERYGVARVDIEIETFDEMPCLPSGKLNYEAIKAHFLARTPTHKPAETHGDGSEVVDRLLGLFARVFNAPVTPQDSFRSLSGDSLRYVEVSMGIERIVGRLPDGWDSLPIAALSRHTVSRRNAVLSEIETGIPVRVVATLLVVAAHTTGLHLLGGGAALLFFASGYNLARFQLDRLLSGDLSGRVMAQNFAQHVLIPYWIVAASFGLCTDDMPWRELLLVGNFHGFGAAAGFGAWFVEALAQSMLVLYLALQVRAIRCVAATRPQAFALGALGVSTLIWLLDDALQHHLRLSLKGVQLTAVLWLFILGVFAARLHTLRWKLLGSALLFALPAAIYKDDTSRIAVLVAGGLAIIWLPRVLIPVRLRPMMAALGSASLFIYMLHTLFLPGNGDWLPWPHKTPIGYAMSVFSGVAAGLVAARAYNALLRGAPLKLHRLLSQPAAEP